MVISFTKLGSYGRLGNQMFQYATVRSVGIQNGYKMRLPQHNFSLREMGLSMEPLTEQDKMPNKYQEKHFHFDEDVFAVPDGTDFFGYFQSYKYFEEIPEILIKEFSVKEPFELQAKQIVDKCLYSNDKNLGVVSIHIRRGDYVKLQEFHPFCGLNYYKKSIDYMSDMGQYTFIVCSDDIEWCKKNISGPNIYYSESNNSFVDLAIMYKCDHNIVANSSFSWWGAWLNRNPNKMILYPSVWFGPKCPQDWYDLIPSEWEKIEVK